MRRSSCLTLSAAFIILAGLGMLFALTLDRSAGPMNDVTAKAFLDSGRKALEAGDTGAIMSLFMPNARVLGTSTEQLSGAVQTAVHEMQGRPLAVDFSKLSVKQDGATAHLVFDIDLNENRKDAGIHYFTSHFNVTLERVESSPWLGLYRSQSWKINHLDADPPFEIPEQ